MSVLPAFAFVYWVFSWFPQRSEEGVRFSETRVPYDCEPSCVLKIQAEFSTRTSTLNH